MVKSYLIESDSVRLNQTLVSIPSFHIVYYYLVIDFVMVSQLNGIM